DRAVRDLCRLLSSRDGEDQFALRSSGVFIRRLIPAAANAAAPRAWKPRGTVLITGGTGALGVHSARWLAKRGAEHLVLVSRRGLAAPGAARIQEELTALGVTVSIVACDVARRDSVAEL